MNASQLENMGDAVNEDLNNGVETDSKEPIPSVITSLSAPKSPLRSYQATNSVPQTSVPTLTQSDRVQTVPF